MKKFFKKRVASFGFAFQGIQQAIQTETNLKIHLLATIAVLSIGFVLKLDASEWLWIVLAIVLVWVSELFNTAIESLCDLVQPEKHPIIKRVKDICAAAVLISAVFAAIVGTVVFLPRLYHLFRVCC
jgi:diacylglycerol kinase